LVAAKTSVSETNPDIDILNLKLKVQDVLDELLSERLIPFGLTAQRVGQDCFGKYLTPFFDSRLHSIRFSERWQLFQRSSASRCVGTVKGLSGPLLNWNAQPRPECVAVETVLINQIQVGSTMAP